MSPSQFYRAQAVQQQSAADAAILLNVRDRCQRAADAWGALATRSENTDTSRALNRLAEDANEIPDRGSASA